MLDFVHGAMSSGITPRQYDEYGLQTLSQFTQMALDPPQTDVRQICPSQVMFFFNDLDKELRIDFVMVAFVQVMRVLSISGHDIEVYDIVRGVAIVARAGTSLFRN
jgi:hypothetical protein